MGMTGSLSVLNVGAGDIEFKFNQHKAAELAEAVRMLGDMQRRGYAILVKLPDGSYTRALEIDGATGSYIIQEPDDIVIDTVPQKALPPAAVEGADTRLDAGVALPAKRRGRRGRVPIATSHAVSVARSAGG